MKCHTGYPAPPGKEGGEGREPARNTVTQKERHKGQGTIANNEAAVGVDFVSCGYRGGVGVDGG